MTRDASGSDRSSKSIVVIDDDEDLAAMAVMLLESKGYRASFALTGTAGLALVASTGAHAVLLDYMLPDMTGADVAVILRSAPATCEVPILMCTGTAEAIVRKTFSAYHTFLVKPVAPVDLMRALDSVFTQL
jgi:CheY-like chemotaxis protein